MIEELEDIVEEIANHIGVYGPHQEDKEKCPCRTCFVFSLAGRIRTAVEIEDELRPRRSYSTRVHTRRNPNPSKEESTLVTLQKQMTEYFKRLTEKELATYPGVLSYPSPPWTAPPPPTVEPSPIDAEFVPPALTDEDLPF